MASVFYYNAFLRLSQCWTGLDEATRIALKY